MTYDQKEEQIMTKLLLYFMANIIAMSFFFSILPGSIVNVIQIITLCGFCWNATRLASSSNIESRSLRKTFTLLIIWTIYIVVNGINFSYDYAKEYLFEQYRFLQFIIPLIVLIPLTKAVFINKLMSLYRLTGRIFLLLLPFYILLELYYNQNITELYIWVFATGSGFVLLTSSYHSRKEVVIASIVVFTALILATLLARRNIMLTYAAFMFAAYWIYLFYKKEVSIQKKIASLAVSLLILVGGFYVFTSNQATVFSKISSRAMLNTRDRVFLGFSLEMAKSPAYLIIGKGVNGTYYAPGVDKEFSGKKITYRDQDHRMHIETGYLQLILNGGIVYLLIFLAILLPAAIKGLFRSRNLFVKGCAILVFLWLVDMVPFGVPSFSLRYLLVWICVGICFSGTLRNMNNDEMISYLNFDEDENSTSGTPNS